MHTKKSIDGVTYPSVTEILQVVSKPYLRHWYASMERKRMLAWTKESPKLLSKRVSELERCEGKKCSCAANKVKTDAGDTGTEWHRAAEKYLKREDVPSIGEANSRSFSRFMRWADRKLPILEKSEVHVVSHVWQYQGTFDWILVFPVSEIKVHRFMADGKTSNSMDPLFRLQIGAYAGAYIEQERLTWDYFDGGLIERFDKREKPYNGAHEEEVLTREELKQSFDIFCSLRRPFDFALKHGMLEV